MDIICLNNSVCIEPCLGGRLNKRLHSRLGYIILNAICLLFAMFIGKVANQQKYSFDGSMYSISFALTLFHLLIIIISLTGTTVTMPFIKGLWTLKFLIIFGVYLECFFLL